MTAISPAALASASPRLAPLGLFDGDLTLSRSADLGADFAPPTHLLAAGGCRRWSPAARRRRGLPLLGAALEAQGTPDAFDLRLARLELQRRGSALSGAGFRAARRRHDAGGRSASTSTTPPLPRPRADLPALWPAGVGGDGASNWITENITAGVARDGHLEMSVQAPEDFPTSAVNSVSAAIDGHDLTVSWLRPVPPIEHGEAKLTLHSLDAMEIEVKSGAQGGLAIRSGTVRFTGLSADDQFADIDANIAGSLADPLSLLHHPRLHLFDRRPLALRDPSGQVVAALTVPHLPLRDQVTMDDIQVHATAHVTDVHLGAVVAGRDLDNGTLDLDVGNDGMKLTGSATLAGIAAQLQADLDFRAGAPTEVLQKISVSGTATDRQLAAAGLDTAGMLTGSAAIQAVLQDRRDGSGDLQPSTPTSPTPSCAWRGSIGPTPRRPPGGPPTRTW